jgi:hypothetical protein
MKTYQVDLNNGGFFLVFADTFGEEFGQGYKIYKFFRGDQNDLVSVISCDLVNQVREKP